MAQSIPLTFGELQVGDKFISFPLDGDDSGHGGYRKGSYLFEKTSNEDRASAFKLVDNSKRIKDGGMIHSPLGMQVLKVL